MYTELLRDSHNHKYEYTGDGGILFPASGILARGEYVHALNGRDQRADPNLLVNEGLIYLLSVGLNNGTKSPTWYLALYAANYTPTSTLTAASFPATASEITSATEGYTGAVRPTWVPTAPTTPIIDSITAPASYTITTASTLTINGAALLSEATRGAVTGKLVSATKFAIPRTAIATDVFTLAYRITLSST